jgi:hypothetical protein
MVWLGMVSFWFSLCVNFVIICALCVFVIILCDTFMKLNWVVLAYNFNIREWVLINYESGVGVFLLTTLLSVTLLYSFAYHFIPVLAE